MRDICPCPFLAVHSGSSIYSVAVHIIYENVPPEHSSNNPRGTLPPVIPAIHHPKGGSSILELFSALDRLLRPTATRSFTFLRPVSSGFQCETCLVGVTGRSFGILSSIWVSILLSFPGSFLLCGRPPIEPPSTRFPGSLAGCNLGTKSNSAQISRV